MSERTKKFSIELDTLIERGANLLNAIQYNCYPKEYKVELARLFAGNKLEIDKHITELPDFRNDYQAWYSEAQAVVSQVIPNRLRDFVSYYEYPKVRSRISFHNYMIRDYLQGLKITRSGETTADGSSAIPEFVQQLSILKAAKAALSSSLMDLKAVLQADLFDTEIESAEALARAGYLRAAGAICGVVLEKHLLHICEVHGIRVLKKNPGISDLIQLLKDSDIITVVQWRFIQSLADIRNVCDHAKGREPTKDEIADLVVGTQKILKQVF